MFHLGRLHLYPKTQRLKGLPGTNTLAYYKILQITSEKSFVTFARGWKFGKGKTDSKGRKVKNVELIGKEEAQEKIREKGRKEGERK